MNSSFTNILRKCERFDLMLKCELVEDINEAFLK